MVFSRWVGLVGRASAPAVKDISGQISGKQNLPNIKLLDRHCPYDFYFALANQKK